MDSNTSSLLEKRLLAIWLAVNLCIGILIVHQYGVSFDEPGYYRYAASSLEAYRSFFGRLYEPNYGQSDLPYYGPAFITLVAAAAKLIQFVWPSVFIYDIWHFSYFLLFQLTGICLYALARRWFSQWTAWGILLLFISQPLLWGHAFINPKDVPFMFFFTLSILAGFRLIQPPPTDLTTAPMKGLFEAFGKTWNRVSRQKRGRFITVLLIEAAIVLAAVVFRDQISGAIEEIVKFFHAADADSWAGRIFSNLAAQAANVPLNDYVNKTQAVFIRLELGVLIAGLSGLALYLGLLITDMTPGAFLQKAGENMQRLIAGTRNTLATLRDGVNRDRPVNFALQTGRALTSVPILLAGVALGLTISVRALGPLAGLIVVLYLIAAWRERSVPLILAYGMWAALITYLTWPFLWLAPVQRFLETAGMMASFPWSGRVLFEGHFYRADSLPWSYLPVLFNIQLTETFLLISYAALVIFLWRLFRERIQFDLLLYISLGFGIPLIALIWLNSTLYDNFRQLLFLLPAMFLAAGFALETVFDRVRSNAVRIALILAMALPGIYSTVRLHPYQYIYYNSLAGGVGGAYEKFEMDYWRVSYRELALNVNQFAEQEARIIFFGAPDTFMIYARPDLLLEKVNDASFNIDGEYDYAVVPSRWRAEDFYPAAGVVYAVERDHAVLAVIKSVRGQNSKPSDE